MTVAPEELKACCAAAYSAPAARWLLGERLHPGGAALTSRLVRALRLGFGDTLVDVGSGTGASALQAARESGCRVVGVELSPTSVIAATEAAEAAGFSERVRFLTGEAGELPLRDASADGVLCECSLCLFSDRRAAAAEIARVLSPGARLALSDVTAAPERLPPLLRTLPAWVACVGGARPLEEVAELLEDADLAVEIVERHDEALAELVERAEARLRLGRLVGNELPAELRGGIDRALDLVATIRSALSAGALGYGLVVGLRR